MPGKSAFPLTLVLLLLLIMAGFTTSIVKEIPLFN